MNGILSIIEALFGIAKNVEGLIMYVKKEKIKTKGIKNKILNEVEFNMELILVHYLENEADVEKVIKELKIENLSKAIDEGFDFKKMKKGKIDEKMIGNVKFFKYYVGYDCEAILKNIRFHIDQIKLLPKLYNLKRTKKVNARRRLQNLGKRYILFTKFLESKQ